MAMKIHYEQTSLKNKLPEELITRDALAVTQAAGMLSHPQGHASHHIPQLTGDDLLANNKLLSG